MTEVQKLLAVARAELGYRETGDNVTKYAAELDKTDFYNGAKNGYAWCEVFVDWCFYKAFGHDRALELLCQPTGSCGAGCSFSANYYKSQARWSSYPKVGAQIYLRGYAHTGIVESINGKTLTTIEGNTSDMVARRTYTIGDGQIDGYGVPDYSEEETEEAPAAEIVAEVEAVDTNTTIQLRMLSNGFIGNDVVLAQVLLLLRGYDVGVYGCDGEFGNDTESAVKAFQEDNQLEVDGIVGEITWHALLEIYG